MKPRFIPSLLLAAGLLTPPLRAQDAAERVREIERKVLQQQYQKGIDTLVASKGEAGRDPEIVGKRVKWLALVSTQIKADGHAAAAPREDVMSAGKLNELAWDMITSPDAGARHPEIALRLADIALELGGRNDELRPGILDTKARALFLSGKREEAIAEQEKAVAAAIWAKQRSEFEATLAFYKTDPEEFKAAVAKLEGEVADKRKLLGEIIRAEGIIRDGAQGAPEERAEPTAEEKAKAGISAQKFLDAKKALEAAQQQLDDLKRGGLARKDRHGKLPEISPPAVAPEVVAEATGTTYLLEKLKTIVIPEVEFQDTSLEEAVDFLRQQSKDLDVRELDPARKGVNFVILGVAAKTAPAAGGPGESPASPRIKELRLKNVPLFEALKYVCTSTRYRFKVDEFAVTLVSQDVAGDLFNRVFKVPANFGSPLVSIQDLLKACTVNFGEGASAVLSPDGMLTVRNTHIEIDKIEQLVQIAIDADERARKQAPAVAEPEALTPPAKGER